MKKKTLVSIGILLTTCLLITGCGSTKLKNGEEKVVSIEGGKVTANNLYEKLKEKYGISVLVDLLDHEMLDKEYKTTEEEKGQVDSQIEQIKSNYEGNEEQFISAIKQYFGVNTEEELRDILALDYKRKEAVNDYVEDKVVSKEEIDEYYKSKTIGKINAKHILIKPLVNDDMSEEDKEKAENEALDKAKDIIKKLNDGEDFSKLAKKYSDDTGTKVDGGSLEEFDNNSDMDENFLQAAAKLKNKSYSKEPVKSQYGYHIIYKTSEKEKPKLKDVKNDIKKTLAEEKLENDKTLFYQSLMDLREDKGIKFTDTEMKKEYKKLMDQLIANAGNNGN